MRYNWYFCNYNVDKRIFVETKIREIEIKISQVETRRSMTVSGQQEDAVQMTGHIDWNYR